MSIKQQGGVFGRNPTFNNVTVEGEATLPAITNIGTDIVAPSSGYALAEYLAQVADLTSASGNVAGTNYYSPAFVFYAGDVLHRGYSFSTGDRPFGYAGDLLFAGGEATRPTLGNVYSTGVGGDVTFRSGAAYGENTSRATYTQGKLIFQTPTAANKADSSYTTRMEIDGPNVSLTSGTNLVVASGNGIDFSATSGTGTSELFDDYEEGTFTPTIIGTTTAGSGTYTLNAGHYTKVGDRVLFNIWLEWTAHTGTGDMDIDGLPFAGIAGNASPVSVYVGRAVGLTAGNILGGYVASATTKISLRQIPTGGGAGAPVPLDIDAQLFISGQYRV